MNWKEETLEYYNQAPGAFVSDTLNIDMSDAHSRFLACVPRQGLILDFGCGSGRDTKAFLDLGYRVEATDGSAELCAVASAYCGIPVKQMLFSELSAREQYDGI